MSVDVNGQWYVSKPEPFTQEQFEAARAALHGPDIETALAEAMQRAVEQLANPDELKDLKRPRL